MKLLKVLLVAGVMLSGVVVPQAGDEPTKAPYCYGHDCHEFL